MEEILLFVYGTLRHDAEGNAHQQYLASADFLTRAKVRGQLFKIDYYPGLCLSQNEEWVTGDIYLLQNIAQLHRIDNYEDYDHHATRPQEYKREQVSVYLPNQEEMQVWVYTYQKDTSQLLRIASGDFLKP